MRPTPDESDYRPFEVVLHFSGKRVNQQLLRLTLIRVERVAVLDLDALKVRADDALATCRV